VPGDGIDKRALLGSVRPYRRRASGSRWPVALRMVRGPWLAGDRSVAAVANPPSAPDEPRPRGQRIGVTAGGAEVPGITVSTTSALQPAGPGMMARREVRGAGYQTPPGSPTWARRRREALPVALWRVALWRAGVFSRLLSHRRRPTSGPALVRRSAHRMSACKALARSSPFDRCSRALEAPRPPRWAEPSARIVSVVRRPARTCDGAGVAP
jgi:hypothetical protein